VGWDLGSVVTREPPSGVRAEVRPDTLFGVLGPQNAPFCTCADALSSSMFHVSFGGKADLP